MALLLIVGGLSVVTFQVASKTRRQAMARIDVAEKSRASLETITRELGEALITGAGRIPFPEDRSWSGVFEAIDLPGDEDGDGLYNEEEISFIGINRNRPYGDLLDNDGRHAGTGGADCRRREYPHAQETQPRRSNRGHRRRSLQWH
jgi:hypothetical protein